LESALARAFLLPLGSSAAAIAAQRSLISRTSLRADMAFSSVVGEVSLVIGDMSRSLRSRLLRQGSGGDRMTMRHIGEVLADVMADVRTKVSERAGGGPARDKKAGA